MSRNYDEGTELTSFRLAFSVAGGVAILIASGIVQSMIPEEARALRYTILGLLGGVVSVLSIYWCIFGTFGYMKKKAASEGRSLNVDTGEEEESFVQQLRAVFSNRPFVFVVGIYLFSWLALQITAAVLPFLCGVLDGHQRQPGCAARAGACDRPDVRLRKPE